MQCNAHKSFHNRTAPGKKITKIDRMHESTARKPTHQFTFLPLHLEFHSGLRKKRLSEWQHCNEYKHHLSDFLHDCSESLDQQ